MGRARRERLLLMVLLLRLERTKALSLPAADLCSTVDAVQKLPTKILEREAIPDGR